jgi:hypothetical protein
MSSIQSSYEAFYINISVLLLQIEPLKSPDQNHTGNQGWSQISILPFQSLCSLHGATLHSNLCCQPHLSLFEPSQTDKYLTMV